MCSSFPHRLVSGEHGTGTGKRGDIMDGRADNDQGNTGSGRTAAHGLSRDLEHSCAVSDAGGAGDPLASLSAGTLASSRDLAAPKPSRPRLIETWYSPIAP